DNVEHSDPPLFLREARQWMQRWLKGDATPLPEETNSPPKETAEDLACLARLPDDAVNYRIQHQFTVPVSLKRPASQAAWERRRAELMARLKDKVFRWFPTATIPFDAKVTKNSGGWGVRYGYADFEEVLFNSEGGVRIRAQLWKPKKASGRTPLLIWAKRANETFY